MQTTERAPDDGPQAVEMDTEYMQDLLSQPNRRARRIHLSREVQMRMADLEGFVEGRAQNVSATGMFVQCRTPRPPGAVVGFEFRLGEGSPLIRGRGEVMWVRHRDAGPHQPAGMGMRFLDLDPRSRQLIAWTVERRTREQRRSLHMRDPEPEIDTVLGAAVRPSELEELCNEIEDVLGGILPASTTVSGAGERPAG